MTTAEAREKLTQHGLTTDQAAGVVDVLELWEKDRIVTRDYLDKRLAEFEGSLKGWFANTLLTALLVQTGLVLGGVYFIITTLLSHYKP